MLRRESPATWASHLVYWDTSTHDLRRSFSFGSGQGFIRDQDATLSTELKLAALFHETSIIQDSMLVNCPSLFDRFGHDSQPHDLRHLLGGRSHARGRPPFILGLRASAASFSDVHHGIGVERAFPDVLERLEHGIHQLDHWLDERQVPVVDMPYSPGSEGGFKALVRMVQDSPDLDRACRARVRTLFTRHMDDPGLSQSDRARPRFKPIYDQIKHGVDDTLSLDGQVMSVFKTARAMANAYELRDTLPLSIVHAWDHREYTIAPFRAVLPSGPDVEGDAGLAPITEVVALPQDLLARLSFQDVDELREAELRRPDNIFETARSLVSARSTDALVAHLDNLAGYVRRLLKDTGLTADDWKISVDPSLLQQLTRVSKMKDGRGSVSQHLPVVADHKGRAVYASQVAQRTVSHPALAELEAQLLDQLERVRRVDHAITTQHVVSMDQTLRLQPISPGGNRE